jgi:ParB/RepB/Spo0J family partition protein
MSIKVKLSQISPSPDNASGRSEMNEEMEELIATVKAQGVVGGISVRPNGKGYEIIDGERRWFAATKAGNIKEVDVVVHDVTAEEARLMRLASLSHKDWEHEEFVNKIVYELANRFKDNGKPITYTDLSKLIGVSNQKIGDAAAYYAAKNFEAVVIIDGEVKIPATIEIWQALNPDQVKEKYGSGYPELVKKVTNKCSEEKIAFNMEVRKLVRLVKKALPNDVAFGEPDDKDYEIHNFEIDAILRIPWDTEDFETEVKYMTEGMEEAEHKRWEAARFNKKAMKDFTNSLIAWQKAIKQVERTKHQFSPEAAQFCVNALAEIRELEDSITTFFLEVEKELPK